MSTWLSEELSQEISIGMTTIGTYMLVCVLIAVVIRLLLPLPDEVYRKFLHVIVIGMYYLWTTSFSHWTVAAGTMIAMVVVLYPVLVILDLIPAFGAFLNERKKGELQHSILWMGAAFVIVIALSWGIFKSQQVAICAFFSWGFGDAAAAVIGVRFGKHKIGKEKRKSVEGTVACFVFSFFGVLLGLHLRGALSLWDFIVVIPMTAFVTTVTEFYSPKGSDTILCPVAAVGSLLITLGLTGQL